MHDDEDGNHLPPIIPPKRNAGRRPTDVNGTIEVGTHQNRVPQGQPPVRQSAGPPRPPVITPQRNIDHDRQQPPPPMYPPRSGGQSSAHTVPGNGYQNTSRPQGQQSHQGSHPSRPGGPGGPQGGAAVQSAGGPNWRRLSLIMVLVLVFVPLLWFIGLGFWANGKIEHIPALSDKENTPGRTYLLAGSDSRADGTINDGGPMDSRADTIMLLHVPDSGPSALISIPRDSYVDIPGYGGNKINAAYALGGPELMVETVENLTNMKVDHFVEIGFGGVAGIVEAVGGVELCLDYDVNDELSGLVWTSGCQEVDGMTALAFSRMRYSDPQGDIGRAERQRQVISAITQKVKNPALVFQPKKQVDLITAGLSAVSVDNDTSAIDLARLAIDFKNATGPKGITGTPPIANLDYRSGGVGSAVLLDPDKTPKFFSDIAAGKLEPGVVGGL